jgi:dihydrofolate reductase
MINIIAAVSKNNVIGINNSIPWKIKEDMQMFKKLTTNNTIIMGRKTFESIGKPLPNRNNIVITSKKIDNITTFNSLKEAIENTSGEIFLIGGSKIYEEGMNYADKLYITLVNKSINGDTYFPFIDPRFICKNKSILSEDSVLLEYEV